jgi:hypothetical protein
MSKIKPQYGLIETFSPHPDIVDCSDEKCGRPVKFMDKCFIDGLTGDIFCGPCGICIRYERKMAARREEMGVPDRRINGE